MPDTSRPRPSVLYRWIVLVFISVAMGGNYYIYDSINPLEGIFKEQLGFSATQFGWLNHQLQRRSPVLTLLIGGIVIDRIGTKKAIAFFAAALPHRGRDHRLEGPSRRDDRRTHRAWAGRRVDDRGGHDRTAKWFKGKELSFAFGINLTSRAWLRSAADNSPSWAKSVFYPHGPAGQPSWQGPFLIAVGAGVLGVVTALVYWFLESNAEATLRTGQERRCRQAGVQPDFPV